MQSFDELRKQSAAKAYESPQFNEALDEVLHPGGLKLTARVAEVAQINSRSHVLDIASGRGTSAFFLAQQYGCQVLGIDLSMTSTSLAMAKTEDQGLESKVGFAAADAERLPFLRSTFDVVISECSFSLLPDKEAGAKEIARVIKPKGRLVITDVFLRGQLSDELRTNATFDSCFSGAETIDSYIEIFTNAGLIDPYIEDHSIELKRIAYKLQIGYGSLEAFWNQFGASGAPCCAAGTCSAELVKRMFMEGKPGYALMSFTKAGRCD